MRALAIRSSLLLVALTGCVAPLDNPSTLHDLRILAINTDPPEIAYPAHGDAGLFNLSCTADFTPLVNTPSVTLSALVGDPAGQGRSLHYVFTGCAQTGDGLCPDAGGYVLGEGNSPAPVLTVNWALAAQLANEEQVQATCQPGQACQATPLLDTFSSSTFNTCRFGVWFQIGLEVDASDGESVFGSKLMVFTPVPDDYPNDAGVCPQGPDGGPPPHTNPQLEAFDLDGEALPLASAPEISASFSHILRPVEPTNGPQLYCLPLYIGGWAELTETWLFSAVTDIGQFDREQVGGAASILSNDTGPSTDLNFTWTFPDGGAGDVADLYEVTRDGRGGTSWLIRQVLVNP